MISSNAIGDYLDIKVENFAHQSSDFYMRGSQMLQKVEYGLPQKSDAL